MENFEKILKRELGSLKSEFGSFKSEFENFKSEFGNLKNEFGNLEKHFVEFREVMKNEMSGFKSEMREEMSNFKTEVKDEIREKFFVFEQDYGRKIDGLYDVVVLNKQITDNKIDELEQKVDTNDMRIIKNSLDINSLNSKKVNSKRKSKN